MHPLKANDDHDDMTTYATSMCAITNARPLPADGRIEASAEFHLSVANSGCRRSMAIGRGTSACCCCGRWRSVGEGRFLSRSGPVGSP